MKINELARPRRAQQAAEVFESYFGNRIRISEMTHRQARVMLGRVRDMLAEERGKRSFHSSEQNPAYMKLLMIEGVLRQRLNEDDAPMGAGVATTPDQKKAAQDQANKMKQAQLQQINKVKDPNVKGAMTAAVQGKSMTPDQQQALANAAMASGAVNEANMPGASGAKNVIPGAKSGKKATDANMAGSRRAGPKAADLWHDDEDYYVVYDKDTGKIRKRLRTYVGAWNACEKMDNCTVATNHKYRDEIAPKFGSVNEGRSSSTTWNNDWYVWNSETGAVKKVLKTHKGAKQFAEKMGPGYEYGGSEYWADNINPKRKQVNELSKDTLKSYAKKAATSMRTDDMTQGFDIGRGKSDTAKWTKGDKRHVGINRAIDRLANESVQHSLRRALTEAELQQAQVVLAAKDLGDRVQKMLEEASTMQVKDLAALTDEIRSEVGVPQASQYNQQVGQLLGTLVQALQATKSGLDAAMGIVTGQEMTVPGEEPDMGMAPPAPEMGAEMGAEMPPAPELGAEMPPEEPAEEPGAEIPGALGRERR